MKVFYDIRQIDSLKKKPSTSELIDWIKLLLFESFTAEELSSLDIKQQLPPMDYALFKNEQDLETLLRIQRKNYR